MEQNAKLTFKREVEALQTIRDELKLKAHLAKADVKDEWNRLENKWQAVEEEIRRTASHAKEPLHSLSAQTKELVDDLKKGYENIVSRLG
jgi:predicted component of type VI protein secretion system